MDNMQDEFGQRCGTGWIPDWPDLRDYSENHPAIEPLAKRVGVVGLKSTKLPARVDRREFCLPVDSQGRLGSCSAFGTLNHTEAAQRMARGTVTRGSRRALYKFTRNIMGETGDSGAWLREVIRAYRLCGVPPEEYWPYLIGEFDVEPGAFVYSLAENFEATRYFRHDPQDVDPLCVLGSIKKWLAKGPTCVGGFFGFGSFSHGDVPGCIPVPEPGERAKWAHAVHFCGYDDDMTITNRRTNRSSRGALIFENSWDDNWGDSGFGYLPYEYVLRRWCRDQWTVTSQEWVDQSVFE